MADGDFTQPLPRLADAPVTPSSPSPPGASSGGVSLDLIMARAGMPMPTGERVRPPARREPVIRRWLLMILCLLATALSVLWAIQAFQRIDLFRRAANGELAVVEADRSDRLAEVIVLAWLIASLATGVVALLWIYGTVRNAAKRYPKAEHRPLMTVLAIFVPILNLFVPWSNLRDAAECDDGRAPAGLRHWHLSAVLGVLSWIAWTPVRRHDFGPVGNATATAVFAVLLASLQILQCVGILQGAPAIDERTAGTFSARSQPTARPAAAADLAWQQ